MRNSRLATAAALLMAWALAGPAIAQQQHSNTASGFKADGLYELLGLDTVNVFNGNLIVNLPLGLRYPNGGGSNFGLTLSYNSRPWAVEQRSTQIDVDIHPILNAQLGSTNDGLVVIPQAWPTTSKTYMLAYPDRRNNAGMGWSVSLGQLFGGNDANLINQELLSQSVSEAQTNPAFQCTRSAQDCRTGMYISPDGAEHVLYINPSDGNYYTKDTTYIRVKMYGAGAPEQYAAAVIDFPDGGHHTFEQFTDPNQKVHFRLRKIRDAFGNTVTIDYPDAYHWQITDAFGRPYKVTFLAGDTGTQPNFPYLVSQIDVPKFGSTTVTNQYKFAYEYRRVNRDLTASFAKGEDSDVVPVLLSLSMPEGQAYTFDYNTQAQLSKMALPAGGHLEWSYGLYRLPTETCDHQWENFSFGVVERKIYDNVHGAPMTWTYSQKLTSSLVLGTFHCACDPRLNDISGSLVHYLSIQHAPLPLSVVTTTVPSGEKTLHYFSVWPVDATECPTVPELSADFGLPYTRRYPYIDAADNNRKYYLSEETYDASGKRIRVKYVTYNDDEGMTYNGGASLHDETNRRLDSVKIFDIQEPATGGGATVVPQPSWIKATKTTIYSDWDNAGHFRTTKATSWDGTSRTATTNYTPDTNKWLLTLYDSVATTQTSAANVLASTKELVKLDPNTGFVLARRRLFDASGAGPRDVLGLFTSDSAGNLTREEWFGGGANQLSADPDPFKRPTIATYRTDYNYDHGVVASSMAVTPAGSGTNFLLLSRATIDPSTSLVSSTSDPAGCPPADITSACLWTTIYTFDSLGRITAQKPPLSAWTTYTYVNATSTTPAQVYVDRRRQFGILRRTQYVYDALGRLTQEIYPAATAAGTATRTTTYDAFGRRSTVSELQGPGEPLHVTTYDNFDPYGRPQTVAGPDGSTTRFSFVGDRITTRTVYPNGTSGTNPTAFTTTEERDSFGQLIHVTEPSGNGNALLCTSYAYDVAGNLATVTPADANCVPTGEQPRYFQYDARGFLTLEHVPEKGAANGTGGDVRYSYDAKGHVTTIIDADKELDQQYDVAERLTKVTTPAQTTLKEFYYDFVPNDNSYPLMPGRLYETVRHNYTSSGDQQIKQFFRYNNLEGGLSDRITDVGNDKKFAQSIGVDILGDPVQINYPTCSNCGASAGASRQINRSFTNGFLTEVNGFTARPLDYASNGMVTSVPHKNGVVDIYTPDSSGLPRPSAISFAGSNTCSPPSGPSVTATALSIATGSSAELHVAAAGTMPMSFTWYRHDVGSSTTTVAGTGSDLIIGGLTVSTVFWAVATNICSTIGTQSNTLTITVSDAPQFCSTAPEITSQPASQQAVPGSSVFLSVGATTVGCRFQWYKGNSGDRSTPLGTAQSISVTPTVTTSYWVLVSNDCGSVNSAAATITLAGTACSLPAPWMTFSRTSIPVGGSAMISTPTVAGATFQWEQRPQPELFYTTWSTLPGTTASITVSPTVNTSYRVTVTAPCASGGSSSATATAVELAVTPPVAYDFDGDGIPDVVWRDQSASRVWITSGADLMNNQPLTTIADYSVKTIPVLSIYAVADLDADNLPDLVWHEHGVGDNIGWRWGGSQFDSQWRAIFMNDATTNAPEWELQGAGQYRYGTSPLTDLIYRNYRSGAIRVVPVDHFNGLTPIDLPGDSDLSWKIVGVGNINNDGATDFVWRQFGTGKIRIWFMGHVGEYGTDSNGVRSIADLGTEPDLNWRIAEVADFNGDGYGDILWHNVSTGAMRLWQANAGNWSSPTNIPLSATMTGNARVAGSGDINACATPSVSITNSGSATFCSPNTVTLTANGGTRWLWSNGATTQSITVSQSGPYSVTAFTPESCSAISATVNITVQPQPSPVIAQDGPLDMTVGQQRVLTASSGSSWAWSTGDTTQSITVSTTGDYYVTITNSNGCWARSATTHVAVHPLPPSNVVASITTINNNLAVNVTYTPVAGANYAYVIQRSSGLLSGTFVWQAWTTVPNPDTTVVPGKTYFYRVLAVDGVQTSLAANVDLVTVMRFTDDPIAVPATKIKAIHISELRTAVNAVRAGAGLSAYTSWAVDTAALGTQKAYARDMTELRSALNEALDRLVVMDPSLGRPLYEDPLLPPLYPVRLLHLQQLRDRAK